jgi:Ca2+/Na+ antiporter
MTEQIHRTKINKSKLVYLRSVYLFCHLTCLSSLCVFVLSFDLFIFALCICSVISLVYLRSVYLFCHSSCRITEQIHRAKINKSNDRTNTQNEDKQVKCQNKYTRSVYLFCHLTCLSSLCVFVF